jgi:DNA-binding LacI/PurR family transcriptional regulator
MSQTLTIEKKKSKAGRKADKRLVLRSRLSADIQSGRYVGKLPGIADLAAEYSANPLTVRRALDDLEKNGLIEKKPRIGTFVKPKYQLSMLFVNRNPEMKSHEQNPSPVYDALVRGAREAKRVGRISFETHVVSIYDIEYIEMLKSTMDALILVSDFSTLSIGLDNFSGAPMIRAMGLADELPISHVTYDNKVIGKIAAEWLLEHGCRKFYYFGPTLDSVIMLPRLKNFSDRLAQDGFEIKAHEADISKVDLQELMYIAEKFLTSIREDLDSKEVGIFLPADIYATPLYQILYSLGYKPQQDVKMISCNNNNYHLNGLFPRPPSIDIRMHEIGSRAVEMLLAGAGRKIEKIILQPEIMSVSGSGNIDRTHF